MILPYGFVGVGGVTYDLAQTVTPPLTFITQAPALPSAPNTIIVGDRGRQFILSEEELGVKTVFALTFQAYNIRVPIGPGGIGLRLEVSDHWTASPLDLRVTELTSGVTSYNSRVQFGAVHHLSATVGSSCRSAADHVSARASNRREGNTSESPAKPSRQTDHPDVSLGAHFWRSCLMANTILHFEIPADDVARAKTFYEKTFGWKIKPFPMPPGQGVLWRDDPEGGRAGDQRRFDEAQYARFNPSRIT